MLTNSILPEYMSWKFDNHWGSVKHGSHSIISFDDFDEHAGHIFTLQRLLFILNSAVLRVPYGHYFGMSRKWSCFVLANYPLKHVIWVFLFLN